MQYKDSIRKRSRAAILIVLAATFIAFIYSVRNVVGTISAGRPVDWGWTIGYEFLYWYIWVAFIPVIIWFNGRFDRHRTEWRRVLALFAFGLLVAPVQAILEYGLALACEWLWRDPMSNTSLFHEDQFPRLILLETFSNFLIYLLIVVGQRAYDYYRRYKEREVRTLELESKLTQAKLQSLKMQLQPHFLFNTLNTIGVLMMRDAAAANRMLVRLSDLLRLSLDHVGAEEVSLRQELEFLNGYLEIEQTRFQHRLAVSQEIEPSTLEAAVPNLFLQPVVENAIRHGIAKRLGGGKISIRSRREGGNLLLEVEDDGAGLGSEELEEGLGLSNTRARFQHLYGSRHRFVLKNAPAGGVVATMIIPFRSCESHE